MVALSITVTRSKISIGRWQVKSCNDKMTARTQKIDIAGPNCSMIDGPWRPQDVLSTCRPVLQDIHVREYSSFLSVLYQENGTGLATDRVRRASGHQMVCTRPSIINSKSCGSCITTHRVCEQVGSRSLMIHECFCARILTTSQLLCCFRYSSFDCLPHMLSAINQHRSHWPRDFGQNGEVRTTRLPADMSILSGAFRNVWAGGIDRAIEVAQAAVRAFMSL